MPIKWTEKSLNEVSVQQQSKRMENITGVVLDEAGEPIIGASVKVQNTTIGTITDLEGKFKLELPAKSVIEISFIGYRTKTVVVGKEKHISIYMEEDTKALDEVIVVGYGTTSKRKTTAAIASVNAEDIAKVPTANITQSLAGRAPGLIVNPEVVLITILLYPFVVVLLHCLLSMMLSVKNVISGI